MPRAADIEHLHADSLLLQQLPCSDRAMQHNAAGYDNRCGSFPHYINAAIFKLIGAVKKRRAILPHDYRYFRAAHAEQEVAAGFCHIARRMISLIGISRKQYFEAEQVLKQSNVVNALVGLAIFTDIKPEMSADQL